MRWGRPIGWTLLLLLLSALVDGLLSAGSVAAQSDERLCFNETPHCISGRFREFWQQNGGLAVFGFPLTPARQELNRDTGQVYLTQWFERNRLEHHPGLQPPFDVLLGRLGDDRLRQLKIDWRALPPEAGPRPDCLWFEQTRHNLCDQASGLGFKSYWLSHGLADLALPNASRSLALFGLPLTEARQETNAAGDAVLTQWFERARLEWHPTKPDEFKVLLGRLGDEIKPPATITTPPTTAPPPAEGKLIPTGRDCPASHPIKGNIRTSGERIYHLPGGRHYAITIPEACFATEAAARADGFRPAQG